MELAGLEPDAVEDALLALGAQAITLEDGGDAPIYEPPPGTAPLWPNTRLLALFDAGTERTLVRAGLAGALGIDPLPPHEFAVLEARAWEREWLKHFAPMRFGERLWVVPGECEPPAPDACNVLLDPGLAFGTGTHQTTALCLAWLDGDTGLPGCRLVDYGCGSGILAVAAAKLGAAEILAVDTDPQALRATRANAERNGVQDRIRACSPDEIPGDWQSERLVANILAAPLVGLAPRFRDLLEPGGSLALSGLLARQVAEVRAAYAAWCELDAPALLDGWARLDGVKVN